MASVTPSAHGEPSQASPGPTGFPERPADVDAQTWASLQSAVQQAKLLPRPNGIGGENSRFGDSVSVDGNRGTALTGAAAPGSPVSAGEGEPDVEASSRSDSGAPGGLSAESWRSIRQQVRLGRYEAYAEAGAYASANPAHGFNIRYRSDGTTELTPRASDAEPWRLGVRLEGVGYERLRPVGAPEALQGDERKLTYSRAGGLTERWVNGPSGLEQWFELDSPPAGRGQGGRLRLALAVEGDFEAAREDGALVFRNGQTELTYDGLAVWDANGEALPAAMRLEGDRLVLAIDDAGARYPVTVDPTFTQQAYLKASNTDGSDEFGHSVAVDGDTVVVGALDEDSSATGVDGNQDDNSAVDAGVAYVFTRDGTGAWSQQAYLKASNTDDFDNFGHSVAVDGDTVVVGALGEESSATGVDGDQSDNSESNAGAAYVFTRDGTGAWSQQAYLKASNTESGDDFGFSVAVAGDTVVVGARLEASSATGVDGNEADNSASAAGAAYVFTRDGTGTWSQQAYLKASNTDGFDQFGWSVAVDGDTVVVGALGEASSAIGVDGKQSDNSASLAGAAYVFTRDGTGAWSQQAYLKASNTDGSDEFGHSVAVDGDTVVVGAPEEDSNATGVDGNQSDNSASFAGAAYVFTRDGTGAWSQQAYLKASNTDGGDEFGRSVAVDGDTAVVGARLEDSSATGVDGDQSDNSANFAGAAYVFTRDGTGAWSQQAYLKASNTDGSDQFGYSVAVDGDTVVVGAPEEDSNATGVDGNQSDNSASAAGAAYVFLGNEAPLAADDNVTTDEDNALSGDVLADNGNGTDSDPDSDPLSVTQVNGNSGDVGNPITLSSGALLTQNANGTFSYDPNGQFESLGTGDSATDSYTYTISDGNATDSATVTVTINGVDDPPDALDDTATVDEDSGTSTIDVLVNDTDIDGGPKSVAAVTQPANATVVNNTTDVGYEPDTHYCNDGSPTDDFSYTLNGGSTASVSVAVTCVNDPPSFTAGGDVTGFEGTPYDQPWAGAISPGPADESGQSVMFLVNSTTNPGLFQSGPAVDAAGRLTFTPAPDTTGTAEVEVVAMDDGGMPNGGDDTSAPATFTVEVAKAADLSIDKTSGSFFTPPGGALTYELVVTNPGPSDVAGARIEDPEPDRLTFGNWECAPSGLASCNTAVGSGPVDVEVTIPEGDSVTVTVDAQLTDTDTIPVTNTATVIAPADVTELTPADNADSDSDVVALFADGMESVEPD